MKTPTGFQYSKTKSVIRFNWKDGAWDEGELVQDDHFSLSYSATVLHYGQAAFEGMKAFRHADGETYVFRPFENCERLRQSCERLLMPVVSPEMFGSALKRVIEDNQDFVPDVESGGSLYIRPFVFGSGPTIGVRPSPEYQFVVLVMPVGDYYTPTAGNTGLNALIFDDYDRAAPYGLGNVKAAGNYSADLLPAKKAKDMGHDIVLYLDAKTLIKYYIENQAINCELNASQDATRNLDASVTYIKQSNYSLCLLSTMLPTLHISTNTNMFNFVHLELSMFF